MAWPKGTKRPHPAARLRPAGESGSVTIDGADLVRLSKALGFETCHELTSALIAERAKTLRASLRAAADRELVALPRPAWP